MDRTTQRRIARNEALFRQANEAIERGRWPGEERRRVAYRCECARLGCRGVVELTAEEYARVRAHPRRFVLIEGHALPQVESVVAKVGGHVVVEKQDVAGQVAERSDPRSDPPPSHLR